MNRHRALFRFIPAILSACALFGCDEHDADIEIRCDRSSDYAYIVQTRHKKFITIIQCADGDIVRPVIKSLDKEKHPIDGLVFCAQYCENGKDARYLYRIDAIEDAAEDDPKYAIGSMKITEKEYEACAKESPIFDELKCPQS